MSAFYIVFVEKPADPAEIAEYRRLGLATLKDRGVKFHTRPGCELHTVEGDEVDVVVVLEFDTVQAAKDWYGSADMKDITTYINENTKGRAFAVKAN